MQVFLCEQVLYSSQDLKHHMKSGDTEGPMAESGFKGHPMCRQALRNPLLPVSRMDHLAEG